MRRTSTPKSPGPGERSLTDRLHSVSIHLLRHARRRDHETGLGPARLSALSVIVFSGPLSLGALAAAEQVKPPTVSRIVDALEADGLVQRGANPSDGRAVEIKATAKGHRLLQLGRRWRIEAIDALLANVTREEHAVLVTAVERLERALREAKPERAGRELPRPAGRRRR